MKNTNKNVSPLNNISNILISRILYLKETDQDFCKFTFFLIQMHFDHEFLYVHDLFRELILLNWTSVS